MARAPVPVAVAGTLCVSTSAVVMKLADMPASVTAVGRCAFALPALVLLVVIGRRHPTGLLPGAGPLSRREHWLAALAGVFLATDLVVWSHAIAAIGAGLGTVVPNLQVLFVSLIGWVCLRERPARSLLLAAPVMIVGLLLVGGLIGGSFGGSFGGAFGGTARAYGSDPALGIGLGVAVAALYSVYIMALRQASASAPVTALTEATLVAAIGSASLGLAFGDLRPGHTWPGLGWLVVLALTSQVLGWLLISASMPRIPAWLVGVILLIQPTGSVTLGYLFLGERPSPTQFAGVVVMLSGVLLAVRGRSGGRGRGKAPQDQDHPPGAGRLEGQVGVEIAVARHDAEPAG